MLISVVSLVVAGTALADTSTFVASKDNNIYAANGVVPAELCTALTPTLCKSNGAGDAVAIHNGVDGASMITRRGLFQFNLGSPLIGAAILPGATITSVTLQLFVTNVSGGGPSTLTLRPLAQSWGEGTSNWRNNINVTGPGAGDFATANDATWIHRFYNTTGWSHVGGTCRPFTACSSSAISGSAVVDAAGALLPVVFNSVLRGNEGMATDVQSWVDLPASNLGWILQTATLPVSVATREDVTPNNRPRLVVNFVPEPSSSLALLASIATLAAVSRSRRRC